MAFKLSGTMVFLLVVIILLFDLFFLVPWSFIPSDFDIRNVGILLLLVGLLIAIFAKIRSAHVLANSITPMILLYLSLVGIHIGLASIYYSQSIFNGIVAARHQFIYLSLFLFLLLLSDSEKIVSLLNYLTAIALIVLVLAVINYVGIPIFHHHRAEDWEATRSGIRRIFIPGTPLLHFTLVWQFCRWVYLKQGAYFSATITLVLLSGIFFFQSRGAIFGFFAAVLLASMLTVKFKPMLTVAVSGIIAAGILGLFMEENLVLNVFTTASNEIHEGTGTWGARLKQIETDLQEFKQHPWIGSGLIAVRVSTYGRSVGQHTKMARKAHIADLGYTHWLKMYGLTGVIWLSTFIFILWSKAWKAWRIAGESEKALALFGVSYLAFVTVSSVTLEHFMNPQRILLFCLSIAVICAVSKSKHEAAVSANEAQLPFGGSHAR